jgi:hypothetical protein
MTTTTRRWLLLPVIAVALVLGAAGPANASFSGDAPLAQISVGTLTVTPPTNVSTAGTGCSTTVDPVTGVATTTLHARLSWTASTTARGVSGYLITAVFSDGSTYPVASVDALTTSATSDVDGSYATQNIRVAVTTLTGYGWTATSTLSPALTC